VTTLFRGIRSPCDFVDGIYGHTLSDGTPYPSTRSTGTSYIQKREESLRESELCTLPRRRRQYS
jgi:hypothetical protein